MSQQHYRQRLRDRGFGVASVDPSFKPTKLERVTIDQQRKLAGKQDGPNLVDDSRIASMPPEDAGDVPPIPFNEPEVATTEEVPATPHIPATEDNPAEVAEYSEDEPRGSGYSPGDDADD
jgi:hypothetical protein